MSSRSGKVGEPCGLPAGLGLGVLPLEPLVLLVREVCPVLLADAGRQGIERLDGLRNGHGRPLRRFLERCYRPREGAGGTALSLRRAIARPRCPPYAAPPSAWTTRRPASRPLAVSTVRIAHCQPGGAATTGSSTLHRADRIPGIDPFRIAQKIFTRRIDSLRPGRARRHRCRCAHRRAGSPASIAASILAPPRRLSEAGRVSCQSHRPPWPASE